MFESPEIFKLVQNSGEKNFCQEKCFRRNIFSFVPFFEDLIMRNHFVEEGT